jgi:universal stress protein A
MKRSRILVPLDFSDSSRAALRTAAELAGPETVLTLLHVNPLGGPVMLDWSYQIPADELVRLTRAADDQLRRWAEELGLPAARLELEADSGDPATVIIAYSERADLVVMGTHGRKGLSRLLIGSVAERVVRGAQCSVLIVRGGK